MFSGHVDIIDCTVYTPDVLSNHKTLYKLWKISNNQGTPTKSIRLYICLSRRLSLALHIYKSFNHLICQYNFLITVKPTHSTQSFTKEYNNETNVALQDVGTFYWQISVCNGHK